MGEILPNGSIQGYQAYCQKCGKIIDVNAQGTELINERHICIPIIKTGHIKITPDGIRFEYHELEKPEFHSCGEGDDFAGDSVLTYSYNQAMKEYNASLRSVEVENIINRIKNAWIFMGNTHAFGKIVKNNQPCEAEVNGKAEIIKIL